MGTYHTHSFMYHLRLFLYYKGNAVIKETKWPTKPEIGTVWPLLENVC